MTQQLAAFEDSTLIERTLAGQADCFTVLMDRHLAALRRCIGSMVQNRNDVDDLLQEVLLKVWRHLSTFRLEASFRTWVTRVAVNEVLQLYRRKKASRLCEPLGDIDSFASTVESPHESFARAETTKTVHSAVAKLPARYRQVLVLRDFEELTTQQTAESLQTTIPAVKTRLFRARFLLAASLKATRTAQPTGVMI